MTEKSANDWLKEFKAVFDTADHQCEFKAVRLSDGLTLASKGWIEPPIPRLEITGEDYVRLGSMSVTSLKPSAGVVSGLLKIMAGKR